MKAYDEVRRHILNEVYDRNYWYTFVNSISYCMAPNGFISRRSAKEKFFMKETRHTGYCR
jgi:hypothetical protein